MKKNERIEKFRSLVEPEESGWMKKAAVRKENEAWMNYSALIALRVLTALEKSGKTQKDLALELRKSPQYISKLLKGEQNLTLETISRLEKVLSVRLVRMETDDFSKATDNRKTGLHGYNNKAGSSGKGMMISEEA